MKEYDDIKYSAMRSRQEAELIAKRILEQSREKKVLSKENNSNTNQESSSDLKDKHLAIIAELNEKKDEEIERLKEEQKVLRGLASSGIVLASFSHDLSKLNSRLESRVDKLKNLVSVRIDENEYLEVENHVQNLKRQAN